MLLYLLANGLSPLRAFLMLRTLPNTVATETMKAALGRPGLILMAIAIMIRRSDANGLIPAGARLYYAMARRTIFKRAASPSKNHVPVVAGLRRVSDVCVTLPRTVSAGATPGTFKYGNIYGHYRLCHLSRFGFC